MSGLTKTLGPQYTALQGWVNLTENHQGVSMSVVKIAVALVSVLIGASAFARLDIADGRVVNEPTLIHAELVFTPHEPLYNKIYVGWQMGKDVFDGDHRLVESQFTPQLFSINGVVIPLTAVVTDSDFGGPSGNVAIFGGIILEPSIYNDSLVTVKFDAQMVPGASGTGCRPYFYDAVDCTGIRHDDDYYMLRAQASVPEPDTTVAAAAGMLIVGMFFLRRSNR